MCYGFEEQEQRDLWIIIKVDTRFVSLNQIQPLSKEREENSEFLE